jgi:hypothetical protein
MIAEHIVCRTHAVQKAKIVRVVVEDGQAALLFEGDCGWIEIFSHSAKELSRYLRKLAEEIEASDRFAAADAAAKHGEGNGQG